MPTTKVTATLGPAGFTTTIVAGEHVLTADEPLSVGGDDKGPDPYALLMASLGACKAMTLRMYASRKQWPLTGVTVALSHEHVHARDCEDCASTEGRVLKVRAELTLEGDLGADQRARLAEIADRCPVHRSLVGEVVITSALA